ncbi:MAG: hypothetical protein U5K74_12005 [Gemmatimonadaceae bacterium]|nr:hypothetical protein [Gemmatimonadaceae bacterium]
MLALIVALLSGGRGLSAQERAAPESLAVLAIADSALAAISRGDVVGFTDLMVPQAVLFPTQTSGGMTRYRVRTRAEQRDSPFGGTVTERGFRPDGGINGGIAMVWYPYDLYLDDRGHLRPTCSPGHPRAAGGSRAWPGARSSHPSASDIPTAPRGGRMRRGARRSTFGQTCG